MSGMEKTGKILIDIIKKAGPKGISLPKLRKQVGSSCDCENWINTFLENKVVEVCGHTDSGARIIRMIE